MPLSPAAYVLLSGDFEFLSGPETAAGGQTAASNLPRWSLSQPGQIAWPLQRHPFVWENLLGR